MQTAKMEVMKEVAFNPIMQDESDGKPRYYTYGVPFFNYGLIPQTWEDPNLKVCPLKRSWIALVSILSARCLESMAAMLVLVDYNSNDLNVSVWSDGFP